MLDASIPDEASDVNPHKGIIRVAPAGLRPYLTLMRLDRPNGVWLVLSPSWWAIALASQNIWRDVGLLALFALGAFVMRGGGSVVNDIIDSDLDALVARSAKRPIPAGQVSLKQASLFATLLFLVGLVVLLQLNAFAIELGIVAVATVVIYPFAKRFTHWPQVFLGLSIGFGVLMGWAAVRNDLDLTPGLLYLACIFWTLGWDTIYGHQDKIDDARVGIRSGALRLGDATPLWVFVFYAAAVALIAAAGWLSGMNPYFYPALLVAALHLAWQVKTLDIHDPKNCLARFCSNRDFGMLAFAACLIGRI